jgi:O-methyltransferase involved in polyketide biosynthesis
MPEKIVLDGVAETLLLTLNMRACESQRPDAMLKDDTAVAMVRQMDYDFSRVHMPRRDEIIFIARLKKMDSKTREYLARNPKGAVVHIGCGLDTRFERVDNGRVEWFDLDLPDVIALRRKLLQPESSRYHTIPASILNNDWIAEVRRFQARPILFVAEGVLPYFEEAQVKALLFKLRDHFPGCEFICDAGNRLTILVENMHLAFTKMTVRASWGINHARDAEAWGEGICLLDDWHFIDDPETPFKLYHWMRKIPALANSFIGKASGIFHYRLG